MKVLRAEMLIVAAAPSGFPRPSVPEIAFLGRSNVGKSSLLNRLVNRKKLARTSSTPGKTRLVHWYRVEGPARELHLVDLPGYGFREGLEGRAPQVEGAGGALPGDARAAGSAARTPGAPVLQGAVLLQDLRRDLTEDEELLIQWLDQRDVPVLLALTKADKVRPSKRAGRVKALRSATALPAERVIVTSAEKGEGVGELWKAIDALVESHATRVDRTGEGRVGELRSSQRAANPVLRAATQRKRSVAGIAQGLAYAAIPFEGNPRHPYRRECPKLSS